MNHRALSLVETVIAAGVIALIVSLTLGLIPSFKLANRRANMELQANAMAQSRLEELRLTPYAETSNAPPQEQTVDGVTYRSVVTESEPMISGTPPAEYSKKIRVTVTWNWRGRAYSVFRETVICRLLRS